MTEKKGVPTIAVSPNKLAMSRALGAAFLNHQVEQLEKSVNGSNGGNGYSLSSASGNWRNRGRAPPGTIGSVSTQPQVPVKRPPMAPGIKVASKGGNAKEDSQAARKARAAAVASATVTSVRNQVHSPANIKVNIPTARRSNESERDEKEADVVVVDASVLVHALYQVKKWCRDGRTEIVIVPLEALNTLDLLKKGTSSLAQRARAASRILEAQVGTNPRIRVQQDDAFVLWDKIKFDDGSNLPHPEPNTLKPTSPNTSPEWVRRTICCAKWEADHVNAAVATAPASKTASPPATTTQKTQTKPQLRVALAVLSTAGTDVSPRLQNLKLSDSPPGSQHLLNPVPLPGPVHPHSATVNKFEPRSSGTLVSHWATRAGIKILEVEPTRQGMGGGGLSEDEGRGKRAHGGPGARGRRGSIADGSGTGGGAAIGTGLVERPPAVRAMMEMVAQQPSATRVVRVLARGEKLDPDP